MSQPVVVLVVNQASGQATLLAGAEIAPFILRLVQTMSSGRWQSDGQALSSSRG
jgi:hypothetical protein